MITSSDIKVYLDQVFNDVKFYAGAINKADKKCVGIYPKGRVSPVIAIGGIENSSYWVLPLSILVHWGESSTNCEQKAVELYEYLMSASGVEIGGEYDEVNDIDLEIEPPTGQKITKIIKFDLLDSGPVDLARDDKNICEMVIRVNVIYEK